MAKGKISFPHGSFILFEAESARIIPANSDVNHNPQIELQKATLHHHDHTGTKRGETIVPFAQIGGEGAVFEIEGV